MRNNKLHIKPTLTEEKIGNDQIENGYVRLDDCTDADKKQCERRATGNIIINPIRSARLKTEKSFSFKYGRVEVIAKTPQGDWLWPGKGIFFKIFHLMRQLSTQMCDVNHHSKKKKLACPLFIH